MNPHISNSSRNCSPQARVGHFGFLAPIIAISLALHGAMITASVMSATIRLPLDTVRGEQGGLATVDLASTFASLSSLKLELTGFHSPGARVVYSTVYDRVGEIGAPRLGDRQLEPVNSLLNLFLQRPQLPPQNYRLEIGDFGLYSVNVDFERAILFAGQPYSNTGETQQFHRSLLQSPFQVSVSPDYFVYCRAIGCPVQVLPPKMWIESATLIASGELLSSVPEPSVAPLGAIALIFRRGKRSCHP